MTNASLPGPSSRSVRLEHPAAAADRARALYDAIPENPETLTRLRGRHVVSTTGFDAPLLAQIFRLAARHELGVAETSHPLRCKVLSNLFLDHSWCTGRLSFNAAWLRLGGSLLDFESAADRILRERPALEEVAEICNSYSDLTVLRTGNARSFDEILPFLQVPVISAGNGTDEYPANAMADLYMLFKWRPELLRDDVPRERRLQVVIFGDPSRTRTIRSFLNLLARFPNAIERVVLAQRLEQGLLSGQREALETAGLRVETVSELFPGATEMAIAREVLPEMDVVYVHQLYVPQVPRLQILESVSLLKPDAMVLAPEIHSEEGARRLNNSPHNGYFGQARGSVFLRMALFDAILR
jgi:aspartate carbamoyltransferase catalytic subunit